MVIGQYDLIVERDVIGLRNLVTEREVTGQYDLIVERDVISLRNLVTERTLPSAKL